MNEQKKFDRAVKVLVQAYLNDTLEHLSCTRCAVGNLIGAIAYPGSKDATGNQKSMNFQLPDGELVVAVWFAHMSYFCNDWPLYEKESKLAEEQRAAIGYTWHQIRRIEMAFEKTRFDDLGRPNVNAMYDGMMNVVDELSKIHGVDLTHTAKARKLFVSPL